PGGRPVGAPEAVGIPYPGEAVARNQMDGIEGSPELAEEPGTVLGAVRHPQIPVVDDEQRPLTDRGGIPQVEAVDGAHGFHEGRALPRAVGPPELETAGIRDGGEEEQAVSRLRDAAGRGA